MSNQTFAGMTSVFFTYPLEVIRVRLAFHKDPKPLSHILKSIYKEPTHIQIPTIGPLTNFYRGFMPTMYGTN
jgi:solute carrier family 25 protein 16